MYLTVSLHYIMCSNGNFYKKTPKVRSKVDKEPKDLESKVYTTSKEMFTVKRKKVSIYWEG